MKRLLAGFVALLLSSMAHAEVITVTPAASGSGGSFPPTGCVTANGVIFNNATPCDSGLTYAGGGGQLSLNGKALGATTGLLVNPASASGLLADFQVNGTSQWSASSGGATLQLGSLTVNTGGASILTSPSAAKWQFGAANVNGAPVAQTISFQGALAASATNTASANTTITGSLGTGTGTNGDIIFQTGVKTTTGTTQATATQAFTIKGENGGWQQSNGTEYGGCSWVSNVYACGTTQNAGTVRDFRLFSSNDIILNSVDGVINIQFNGGIGAVVKWGTGSKIVSATDGNFILQNNAGTNFNLLQFGATSSSYPAIKRSSATLAFRLADDSADAAISVSTITASALANVATTSAVCYNTGTGVITYDGTVGTCTVSGRQFKNILGGFGVAGNISSLRPAVYSYKPESGFDDGRVHVGLIAQDVARMDDRCAVRNAAGEIINYEDRCVLAHLVADNDNMRAEIEELRRSIAR